MLEVLASDLSGEVHEVGFGSGRNVAHYPPAVTRVLAVDPAKVERKIAARRVAASSVPIEYIGLDGQSLPLPADSVDHALTTWTLCTTVPSTRSSPTAAWSCSAWTPTTCAGSKSFSYSYEGVATKTPTR